MGAVLEFRPRRRRDTLALSNVVELADRARRFPAPLTHGDGSVTIRDTDRLSPWNIAQDWGFTHLAEPILHYILVADSQGRPQYGQAINCLEAALSFGWRLRFARALAPTITVDEIAAAKWLPSEIRSVLTDILYAALAPHDEIRRIRIMSAIASLSLLVGGSLVAPSDSRSGSRPEGAGEL